LDKALAQARRFPAVDLRESYSLYDEVVSEALARPAGQDRPEAQDWPELKEYLKNILLRRRELSDWARSDLTPFTSGAALSEEDRWILFHAETLEVVYLRQSVLDAKDAPSLERSAAMLRLLKALDDKARGFLRDGLRCDDAASESMRPELNALWLSADLTDKGREWLKLFSTRLAVELTAKRLTDEEATETCKAAARAGVDYIVTSTGLYNTLDENKNDVPLYANEKDIKLIRAAVADRVKIQAQGYIASAALAQKLLDAGADRIATEYAKKVITEIA
jgi:hypothetical protein